MMTGVSRAGAVGDGSAGAIVRVRLGTYRFSFREPWPSAEGPQLTREGILLALEDADGRVGVGESAPFPGFGLETFASSLNSLRLAARFALGMPAEHFLGAAADLPRLAPVAASPAARAALDLALHDLAAQRADCSLASLIAAEPAKAAASVHANAVLPHRSPDRVARAALEAVKEGARTMKLKVGGAPLEEDVARVGALRQAVGPSIRIRIDANQAWSETEAIEALRALAPFDIEYAEQPVAAGAIPVLARVRAATGIPIAADESLTDLKAARRLVAEKAADVFIVKPMALGGLAAAHAVIQLARDAGVRVTVTSLVESAVGRAGALHLAASLGDSSDDHGVATGWALAEDVVPDFATRPGVIPIPAGTGIGEAIRAAAAARTEPLPVGEPA